MDADAEVTEPEEHSLDPYDIIRDDPFAMIPQEVVERWDEKRLPPQPHPHLNPHLQPPDHPAPSQDTETPVAQPWSPESPPFSPPHIHAEDIEDFASAESQPVRDTDDFSTPDSRIKARRTSPIPTATSVGQSSHPGQHRPKPTWKPIREMRDPQAPSRIREHHIHHTHQTRSQ